MQKKASPKPIKIPLGYEDTLKAFLKTPPKKRKKGKKPTKAKTHNI